MGSCLIFAQRTAANWTSSFSVLEPRRWPLSWSSFCQGRERDTGVLVALPLCVGASAAPHRGHQFPAPFGRSRQAALLVAAHPAPDPGCGAHLHWPVHVEVVQERVLHLPQHPAEEEEDLLPHPGGVLAGRQGQASARAQLPICVPSFPVFGPNRMPAHPAVSGGSLQEYPPICSPKTMPRGSWTPLLLPS